MYDQTFAKTEMELESILEAFEREDEETGGADVVEFLPDASDPVYERVAVELIRVDLERSWARGSRKRLDAYREVTPILFSDPRKLAEIAFEEYRLRKQAGEPVSSAEYRQRYAIDTSHWPVEDGDKPGLAECSTQTLGGSINEHVPRLTFPRVGDSFAGFDLVEQLGRGAFGVVFRARQADLAAREVVLKVTALRSVEPQRLAKLQHTNIVPLYSMHAHAGMFAICMPYFGRQTLADVIRGKRGVEAGQERLSTVAEAADETLPLNRRAEAADAKGDSSGRRTIVRHGVMSIDRAVEIIAQLAEGLDHAHQREIVHSDLKPANVLLTDDGVPMLLDFNLATDSSAGQRSTLLVGGTLPYMAPEHLVAIRSGSPVLAASDIYSLGVIGFELLTGERPFPDRAGDFDQTCDVLVVDRKRSVPWVADHNPQVSAGLSSIIARCLEPAVPRRYKSAGELAEDLRSYQRHLPLKHAPERSLTERGAKWFRRNLRGIRWAVAASLVIATAACLGLYAARQHRLAVLEAASTFSKFQKDAQTALLNLHAPGSEAGLRSIGQTAAERAIEELELTESSAGRSSTFARLTPEQQAEVRDKGVELLYTLAAQSAGEQVEANLRRNAAALSLISGGDNARSLLEQRARLLELGGQPSEARRFRERAQQVTSDEREHYLAALTLLENRKYKEAVAAWEKLIVTNRQHPTCWLLLGNAYVGVGRLANAEACYTAIIALVPDAMNGYLYRGLCRFDQGHMAGAEEDFTAALQLNSNVPTTRINRALAYYALGNMAAAESDATAAIDGGLNDPRGYFVRALIRDARGKQDLAKGDRERGFTMRPTDDAGWVARGIALLREDPQRAAGEFEKGIDTFPASRPLLQNLVHVYGDRLDQPQQALIYARRLVELNPDDPSSLASQAVLHARIGDVNDACRLADRVWHNSPSAITSLQLACVYGIVARTKPEETRHALESLKRALATDPGLARRAVADRDLSALRDNVEFKALIAAANELTNSQHDQGAASPNAIRAPVVAPKRSNTQSESPNS